MEQVCCCKKTMVTMHIKGAEARKLNIYILYKNVPKKFIFIINRGKKQGTIYLF